MPERQGHTAHISGAQGIVHRARQGKPHPLHLQQRGDAPRNPAMPRVERRRGGPSALIALRAPAATVEPLAPRPMPKQVAEVALVHLARNNWAPSC